MVQPIWKKVWRLIKKLKIQLLHYSVIPLVGIYSKKSNYYVKEASIIAKTWKQPKCTSKDEWIKEVIYILHYM